MAAIPKDDLFQVAATLTAAYWAKTKNTSANSDDREGIVDDYFKILSRLEIKSHQRG